MPEYSSSENASSPSPATNHRVLRAAVIGLGRIGFQFHAPALASSPRYTLAAVADPLPERREEAKTTWGAETYPDLDSLLEREKPDLVVIASPTPFHREHAIKASNAGCHVVCDKPVATSVAEYDAMLTAATAAGRHLIAYQPARFRSEVLALKSIIEGATLGKLHTIARHRGNFVRRNDWQSLRAHGGGMLNNYGAHCLDEILWLLDAPAISSVYCHTDRVNSAGDAEDCVKAVLRTNGGITIDLTISQVNALAPPPWQAHGSCGSAIFDETSQEWRVKSFDPKEKPAPQMQEGLAATDRSYAPEDFPWRESRVAAANFSSPDFYDLVWSAIVEDRPPPVAPRESRLLLEWLERCRAF